MEIFDVLLGAAITGLFASIGTYVGYKLILRRVKKGLLTDLFFDLMADIADDEELQNGIKNMARIFFTEIMKVLGVPKQRRGKWWEPLVAMAAQKYLGVAPAQGQQQPQQQSEQQLPKQR